MIGDPQQGQTVTECRIFTVEEAERTLPLVNRILSDLRMEGPLGFFNGENSTFCHSLPLLGVTNHR